MSGNSQTVSDEERDAVLSKLFLLPENKACFDCKASNPKWASVNNGLFLCFHCGGKHRTFGVHVSFVRSCVYDGWSRKQLKIMEFGGNKNAATYFEKNGLHAEGTYNYSAAQAAKYRTELAKKAAEAVEGEESKEMPNLAGGETTGEESGENESPPAEPKKQIVVVKQQPKAESGVVCKKAQKKDELTLKAKKLDIDFDSIGTMADPSPPEEVKKPKSVLLKPSPKPEPTAVAVSDKIKKAKAISSTDYEQGAAAVSSSSGTDTKEKLAKFAGAQGISSSDFDGGKKKVKTESRLEKIKDMGINVFSKAKEGAQGLKNMASNIIHSLKKSGDASPSSQ